MRVSRAADWATCELRALSDPRREPAWTHAATWVGTLAHEAMLTGAEPNPDDPRAGSVRWDATTPDAWVGRRQAMTIARIGTHALEGAYLTPIATERAVSDGEDLGHLDILAEHENANIGLAIIDLKTGQLPATAWLQVGGYIELAREEIALAGVLHIPRTPLGKTPDWRLQLRPAEAVVEEWRRLRSRIAEIQAGSAAIARPGIHCSYCDVQCAVSTRAGN